MNGLPSTLRAILQCNIYEHQLIGINCALSQDEAQILILQEVSGKQRSILEEKCRPGGRWQLVHDGGQGSGRKMYAALVVRRELRILSSKATPRCAYAQIEGVGGVISFYAPTRGRTQEEREAFVPELKEVVEQAKRETTGDRGILIAGDANSGHESWTSKYESREVEQGQALARIFEETGLEPRILMDLPTFISWNAETNRKQSSTIDVAFARGRLLNGETMLATTLLRPVSERMKRHVPILHHLNVRAPPAAQDAPWHLYKDVDTTKLGPLLDEKLRRAALEKYSCPDQLWTLLKEGLERASSACTGWEPPAQPAKTMARKRDAYWNDECTRRKGRFKNSFQAGKQGVKRSLAKEYLLGLGRNGRRAVLRNRTNQLDMVKAVRADLQRAMKEARSMHQGNVAKAIKNSKPSMMWTYIRKLIGKQAPQREITELRDGKDVFTLRDEIEATLVRTHFPGFGRPKKQVGQARLPPDPFSPDPTIEMAGEASITESEIHQSFNVDPDNAPGIDKIKASLLRKAWTSSRVFRHLFVILLNLCYEHASIPFEWRKARVILLHKSGRDASLPNSYRPISLLVCALKIYARVLAARLTFAGANGGLSNSHAGGLPGKSTEDAIAGMKQELYKAKRAKMVTAMTGVDVKGAFNHAQHGYLKKSLARSLQRAAPRSGSRQAKLLSACMDMLSRRSLSLTFNGSTGEEFVATGKVGLPQGSPVALVLWLYYVNPLVERIEALTIPSVRIKVFSYVDDLNVMISAKSWKEAADATRKVNDLIKDWATREGMVGLDKAFLLPMGLAKVTDPAAGEELRQVGLASDRPTRPPTRVIMFQARVLGVLLTSDNDPASGIYERRTGIILALKEMKSISSAHTSTKIAIARAILWPKLEYGMWSMLPYTVRAQTKLEEIDYLIVSWVLSVLPKGKTKCKPSYMTLLTYLGMLPITQRLWYQARKAGYNRYGHMCTTKTRGSIYEHENIRGPLEVIAEGITLTAGRVLLAPWERVFPVDSVTIEETKDKAKEYHDKIVRESTDIHMYTDGSKTGERTGSGLVIMRQGVPTITIPVDNMTPQYGEVYHAELRPIEEGMRYLQANDDMLLPSDNGKLPSVKIFSDNQAAVKALSQPGIWRSNHPLERARAACLEVRSSLAPGASIEIVWVPGHVGIEGNELADQMAKAAAEEADTLPKGQYTVLDEANQTAWEQAMLRFRPGRTATAIGAGYGPHRGKELRDAKRRITAKQTRRRIFWTGGYAFARWQNMPSECSQCGERFEDTTYEAHLLLKCPALLPKRRQLGLIEVPDAADDWLILHEKLDEYLAHIDPIRLAHIDEQIEEARLDAQGQLPETEDSALLEAAIASLADVSDSDDELEGLDFENEQEDFEPYSHQNVD